MCYLLGGLDFLLLSFLLSTLFLGDISFNVFVHFLFVFCLDWHFLCVCVLLLDVSLLLAVRVVSGLFQSATYGSRVN